MRVSGKRMFYLFIVLTIAVAGYFAWKYTARSAYETAAYRVLESDGSFELREYPPLMMATTSMNFERQGDDGSFMRLFQYISGANDREQPVAMTTPVFMEPDNTESNGKMGFVIPKDVAAARIPEPKSDRVQIRQRDGGRFAVFRFAGRMNSATSAHAEHALLEWIDKRGWEGAGQAEFAGYDPPWTPGFLRRNEVLIRLR